MKKSFIQSAVALAVSSLFTVSSAFASEQPNAEDLVGNFYGGLHLMHIDLDSKRWLTTSSLSSLNNGNGIGGELGYRATASTELRLSYSRINLDSKNGGFDKPRSSGGAFDVLYFPTEQNFYLLAGVTQFDIVDSELSSNLGLGYRHYTSNKTAIYFEAKSHYQFEDYYDDFSAQIGFTYFFGDTSSKGSSSNSDNGLAANGFMSSNTYANMSQADKDLYASMTQAQQDAFANLTPTQRTAFLTMSSAERTAFLSMGEAERTLYANLTPAERALYANMTAEQKAAYASMTEAERSSFMAKLAVDSMNDADNDGVVNAQDSCSDTPASYKVDASGCTVYMDDVESINLLVNFGNNETTVEPQYFSKIEEVAQFLKEHEGIKVVIEGHASALGDDAVNKIISQQRADSILNMLTEKYGIDANRLSAIGYGETRLLNTDNTVAAAAENRRIVATMSVDKKTPMMR